ncbi:histidine--tRNA ligase [Candidatus Woesearchaeota archaeon]|nr:histidine--tRNA ligase [Candidatus Woesearchaeota archaeon]
MDLQIPKGTRDLKPEEMIVRGRIANTLKEVFEIYGFSPLETPVFERFDVLASKYAGGSEILNETFRFKDHGKRELALRYDLTVPFSRFIGMNPNMKMPFKRYQIGDVFRDGPIAASRYRQFTQCDVDVVGCKGMTAEAEIIALANMAFSRLGMDCLIKVNSRKLLNDILDYCDVPKAKAESIIIIIDKMDKIGMEGVEKELSKEISRKSIEKIKETFSIEGLNEQKLEKLRKIIRKSEGLDELEQLLKYLNLINSGVSVDFSLARGLAYYTGTVIEVFLRDSSVKSAVCAGGRYDKMIGNFLGRGEYPAVGVSFGLDRIYDAYVEKKKSDAKSVAQIYVIPIKALDEGIKIAEELRKAGIKTDIDLNNKGISKNLQYANALGIPSVLFIGEEELKSGKLKLRDMKTGEETSLTVKELVSLERL